MTPTSLEMDAVQRHARKHVGGVENFDIVGAILFGTLAAAGLREHHSVLDVGCGCLRVGKLLIPFLQSGHYVGVEPDRSVLDAGILYEVGPGLIAFKKARFGIGDTFDFSEFGMSFDVAFAGSILSHTFGETAIACLRGVRSVLKEDGAFHATFIEEESALARTVGMRKGGSGRGWSPSGLIYARSEIAGFARATGFRTDFDTRVVMSTMELGQRWVTFRPDDAAGEVESAALEAAGTSSTTTKT